MANDFAYGDRELSNCSCLQKNEERDFDNWAATQPFRSFFPLKSEHPFLLFWLNVLIL
jgi:hypothetical protein